MPANSTATALITDSLVKLCVLVYGQPPTQDLLALGLGNLNSMLDAWLIDEDKVYAITPDSYTLTSSRVYTIGPTGDFAAPRPTRIENANYIFTNSSPVVRKPIAILDAAQWSLIGVQDIANAVVDALWYEINFTQPDGNGTIHVWPGAPAGNLLELFTWKQLQQFADLTTSYGFPPGYLEAMQWCLAEKLIPSVRRYMKGPADTISDVREQAAQSRLAIKGYNTRDIFNECDEAFMGTNGKGAWDFRTGWFGRSGGL